MDYSQIDSASAADAAAGVLMLLPFHNKKKRFPEEENNNEHSSKKAKLLSRASMTASYTLPMTCPPPMLNVKMETIKREDPMESKDSSKGLATPVTTTNKAPTTTKMPTTIVSRKGRSPETQRLTRLEQNRRAAKESRERKTKMINELQGSVLFFSRANSSLKQQNEELLRLIIEAQEYITSDGNNLMNKTAATASSHVPKKEEEQMKPTKVSEPKMKSTQSSMSALSGSEPSSHVVITNSGNGGVSEVLPMQPGSSMQAMATFQQAASVAMQEALLGLTTSDIFTSSIYQPSTPQYQPSLTLPSIGLHNVQQAYTDALYRDALTNLIMQQAASTVAAAATTAASNHQQSLLFPGLNPFMMGPILALQIQQQSQQQQLQNLLLQQQQQNHNNNSRSENEIKKEEK